MRAYIYGEKKVFGSWLIVPEMLLITRPMSIITIGIGMEIGTTHTLILVLVILPVHLHQLFRIVDHEQSQIITIMKTILLLDQIMNVARWTIIRHMSSI